jgi:hypothetical protein
MFPLNRYARRAGDLQLAIPLTPGPIYRKSKVLLAKAHLNGTLELLTAAWESALGYGREELRCKTLCQLMASDETAGATAVAAILDDTSAEPVDLTLRCRGGEAKCLRLHRRFDPHTRKVFIVAEERITMLAAG